MEPADKCTTALLDRRKIPRRQCKPEDRGSSRLQHDPESESSCISRNSAAALHGNCSLVLNPFRQVGSAPGKRVARVRIGRFRGPNETPGDTPLGSPTLEAGKGLPDIELETRVERDGSIMIRGLHPPDSDGVALARSFE